MKPDTCIDCGGEPPPAETSYTAIGQGWRVSARRTLGGTTIIEWRCGKCWRASRAKAAKRRALSTNPPPR